MTVQLLTRTLKVSVPAIRGSDVEGVKRTVYRGLDISDGGHRLRTHNAEAPQVRQTYGPFFAADVVRAHKLLKHPPSKSVTPDFFTTMRVHEWPDAYAIELMNEYKHAHPPSTVIWPLVGGVGAVCQGLHETAGIRGNWAIDFCTTPGTGVVAVEAGTVTKLSGHDPHDDKADRNGVFGWSVHFRTPARYEYFVTHLGVREPLYVGEFVAQGTLLGTVGDQKFRPDHCHYGVSSPKGRVDAQLRITQVAASRGV